MLKFLSENVETYFEFECSKCGDYNRGSGITKEEFVNRAFREGWVVDAYDKVLCKDCDK